MVDNKARPHKRAYTGSTTGFTNAENSFTGRNIFGKSVNKIKRKLHYFAKGGQHRHHRREVLLGTVSHILPGIIR